MHGIVTLLSEIHTSRVRDLWRKLKVEHQLSGIDVTPFPHFSWQIGAEYDIPALRSTLEDIRQTSQPFPVHTTGLGLFTGTAPVLYIPVVKTLQLMDYHGRLWETLRPLAKGLSQNYNPENWCPHISLAYYDLNRNNIGPVMESLTFEDYNWQFQLDNIAYIHEPEGTTGELRWIFPFIVPERIQAARVEI